MRTEKYFDQKLAGYIDAHYPQYAESAEWYANPAINQWKCDIPELKATILFICAEDGNITEIKAPMELSQAGDIEYEKSLTDKVDRSYELTAGMDHPEEYPELAMYDEDNRLDLCRENPELDTGSYEVIFEAGEDRFYCFIDGCNSLLEALGLFFRDHPNITFSMVVDHLEV